VDISICLQTVSIDISELTARMRGEDVTYSFCIDTNTFDSRDKVATVAFQENTVFSPMIIGIVAIPDFLELCVVFGLGVQDESI
jgi:hypothetical protein